MKLALAIIVTLLLAYSADAGGPCPPPDGEFCLDLCCPEVEGGGPGGCCPISVSMQ